MNAVRGAMTVFLVVIVWLAFMGWRWSSSLPSPKIEGARIVLFITALAACAGMAMIWKYNPRNSRDGSK
jgi:hypothetical protein